MATLWGGLRHRSVSKRVGALSFFLMLLGAGEARAYRTVEDLADFPDGQRVRWPSAVFEFAVHEVVPAWLSVGVLASTSQRAFDAWSETGCGTIRARYVGLSAERAELGDGLNTVEIVTTGWEALGYDRQALGATDLEFDQDDDGPWQIVEADIRINAEHHTWSLSDAPVDGERSLLGTLRHEGGHAIGLLHPCEPNGEDGAPVCNADSSSSEAIMHPFYDAGQVQLLADDSAAVCYLYPACEIEGCPHGLTCTLDGCLASCGDAFCAADESCVEGQCVSPDDCEAGHCSTEAPEGMHLCEQTESCPHGLCFDSGPCAVPCVRDADCEAGSSCIFSADPNQSGFCSAVPLKQLGERCHESSDCTQGECLAGAQKEPICTRPCGTLEPPCPTEWSCNGVEGRSVCVPPRPARGCSVTPRPLRADFSVHSFILLALAVGSIRLRRICSPLRPLRQAKS